MSLLHLLGFNDPLFSFFLLNNNVELIVVQGLRLGGGRSIMKFNKPRTIFKYALTPMFLLILVLNGLLNLFKVLLQLGLGTVQPLHLILIALGKLGIRKQTGFTANGFLVELRFNF